MTTSKNIISLRYQWTDARETELRRRYPDELAAAIAADLGAKVHQVYSRAKKLGLKKSDEFNAGSQSGRLDGIKGKSTRFAKGNVPWANGKKGIRLGQDTEFKPGNRPHNHQPVGTIVTSSDGYLKRKIAEPKTWEFIHRRIWEGAHGPIPVGMLVHFKDNNKLNCALENLELLTRAEHMQRYTLHNYPKEIAELMQLRGAVTRQINKRTKNEQH